MAPPAQPPTSQAASPGAAPKKFPDFVPPTSLIELPDGVRKLHLRRCKLVVTHGAGSHPQEFSFEKGEIRIGAMEDNDMVVGDDTVSRYHCKIVQEDNRSEERRVGKEGSSRMTQEPSEQMAKEEE